MLVASHGWVLCFDLRDEVAVSLLVLVALHRVRFATPCLSVDEDCCVEAGDHLFYKIVNS